MAQIINLQNVEKLVFLDTELRSKLTAYNNLFYDWGLAQQTGNRIAAQQALMSFLATVKGEHLRIIREHFNDVVVVQVINSDVTKHIQTTVQEAEKALKSQTIFRNMVCAYREDDQLYLSFMR